jgi:hypothetical protein
VPKKRKKCLQILKNQNNVKSKRPKQAEIFNNQRFKSKQKSCFLALNHHHTSNLILQINLSNDNSLWSNTLLFLSFQMVQLEANKIAWRHTLISLQKQWAPQNWRAKGVTLLGRAPCTPNHWMIPFQIDLRKSQFKNKWFRSSKASHSNEQSNESVGKHPRYVEISYSS